MAQRTYNYTVNERTYHYTVNEILIENCKEKIISSRKFDANSKPLINSTFGDYAIRKSCTY